MIENSTFNNTLTQPLKRQLSNENKININFIYKKLNNKNHNKKKSFFNKYLCYAFFSANIPLNKLNSHNIKSFLEKYTSKEIPI